jgi:hypothetical protein
MNFELGNDLEITVVSCMKALLVILTTYEGQRNSVTARDSITRLTPI